MEQIAEYYGTEKSHYKRNEAYSKGGHEVFTVPLFKNVRLSFSEPHTGEVIATKTDSHGIIQSWDSYDITKGIPKPLSVERLAKDGQTHISFNMDEQDMIRQFGEKGKEDTRQRLADIIPLVRDKRIKAVLTSTEKKLGDLSDGNCEMLISYIKRRKSIEDNRSVRKKLDRYQTDIKAKVENRQQANIQTNQI